jgi:hypothetical protein
VCGKRVVDTTATYEACTADPDRDPDRDSDEQTDVVDLLELRSSEISAFSHHMFCEEFEDAIY